jgi:hypothetical protein
MTNEQLSILLSHLAARLDAAIQHADSLCCDDEPRHVIHQYKGLGFWAGFWTPEKERTHPEKWETVRGDVIALDGVRGIVRTIEEQVMILRGASQKAEE